MKRAVYKDVVKTIEAEEWDFDQVLKILCQKFPDEKSETLRSILNQEYQKQVKRTHKQFKSDSKREKIFNEYNSQVKSKDYREGVILKIAKRYRFSSTQIGKIILEEHYKRKTGQETITKDVISRLLKNTALIDDKNLSTEVWLASLKDNNYGVTSEWIKSAVGYEYEKRAKKALEKLGLTYQDEHELRSKGYDKTPDIKLDIPFAYKGHVINWIESKALFGDEEHHSNYLKDQLWSYWNRFGPGLVIYWFGFIEELDKNRDKGILVSDHFPVDIVYCEPLKIQEIEEANINKN